MNKEKFDIRGIARIIFIWIIINLLLNYFGYGIVEIIDKEGSYYDFSYYIPYIITIQSTLFAVTYLIIYSFTRNKRVSLYSFAFIQSILFHGIFLNNLVIKDQGLKVHARNDHGIFYLLYHQQGLIDIINYFYPVDISFSEDGTFFEDDLYYPQNTAHYYIIWIALPLIYYFIVTFLTNMIIKRQPTLNTDDNPGTATQTSA